MNSPPLPARSGCWFIAPPRPPRVTLVYVHPMVLESFRDLATRFVETLIAHPPGHAARLVVVCNGERARPATRELFRPLHGTPTQPAFAMHDNSGWDLGGFMFASHTFSTDCDVMVFFGASTYFRRTGWLLRIVDAWEKHGDTLYGAMGHKGVGNIHAHIRTTAFWMSPSAFNAYPHRVRRPEQRYEFEHGATGLTAWAFREGLTPRVVSWAGEHLYSEWDSHDGYHQNDQKNLLIGDRMSRQPFWHCA